MLSSFFIAIGISLFVSAFFSGIEIAYLTANKLRIELGNKKGYITYRIVSFFVNHPMHFFTTTLVGNNIGVVVFSIFAADLITLTIGTRLEIGHINFILLIQTVASSFVMLILGEFIPKAIFRTLPNQLLLVFSIPFILCYYLLWPLVMLIVFLAGLILRGFFKTDISPQAPEFTRHDLFSYVSESNTDAEESPVDVDKEIFRNAIEFPFLKVRDCMIPRTEIVAIETKDSIEHAKQLFIESGHSKLPVYRETIDHVTGYVHLVEMFGNPAKIEDVIMPIIIATESTPVTELMKQLIEKRRSIAIVVDEFGGTSGLITMEDMIEEIIGEIEDEHDVDDLTEKKISDTEYLFSARLEVDYLNEEYDLGLPEGDYETLGGLILFEHQNIPSEGEVIVIPPFEFTVLSTDQARIKEVRLKITE
jgi:putative hemolysin